MFMRTALSYCCSVVLLLFVARVALNSGTKASEYHDDTPVQTNAQFLCVWALGIFEFSDACRIAGDWICNCVLLPSTKQLLIVICPDSIQS